MTKLIGVALTLACLAYLRCAVSAFRSAEDEANGLLRRARSPQ